ncbi:hypothetical protein VPHK394_0040 [Vibrio phage K394]
MRTKLVKVHREMTECEVEQSKSRMQEVIDMCGGRLELVHIVNTTLSQLSFTEEALTGQEISNCLHRSRTSPQIAIRIERALQTKGDEYKRFTRYYFCPDMTDPQFDRVEASMKFDKDNAAA